MPDLIRHPVSSWVSALAGMTALGYLAVGAVKGSILVDLSPGPKPPGHVHLSVREELMIESKKLLVFLFTMFLFSLLSKIK